ncbi:MAG: hypothetical protein COS35_03605 [Zetaproteobacteria bacterium CG02_land_8_20_14_3_00_50_9]|nr:MAG: hypothetical protein AUJ57_07865 [Zetaproteobacteria bacterium CG1_02_53_45]PIQ34008.1 MAG: hypothetical protein COW62_03520 [Zetaproteobacteria bacterium CG17_big_fil_post_rev_8_21_14_2_50_50_13]PIV31017.1 MAG: hypothetical protein COS35_03605 [Zetaproteobacteria bacterium CG02_land_8_20_14_3_00_50_9]PIY56611.1 MAG: hypothetical protein COZ00_03325 [Zetaproteobacteria bacterium CG_4_10_14_0_8_um_filter_49_80]
MIRNIFISLIFFFGPALLMFVIRYFFLLVKVWLMIRRQQPQNVIIDITPHPAHTSPGKIFITASLLFGLVCAIWIWSEMTDESTQTEMQYIPAHTDATGKVIPGHHVPMKDNGTSP